MPCQSEDSQYSGLEEEEDLSSDDENQNESQVWTQCIATALRLPTSSAAFWSTAYLACVSLSIKYVFFCYTCWAARGGLADSVCFGVTAGRRCCRLELCKVRRLSPLKQSRHLCANNVLTFLNIFFWTKQQWGVVPDWFTKISGYKNACFVKS